MEFAKGSALWNAALSTGRFGFALAEFGIFRWAQNFRDGWNFSLFADLERAGGGFDDAILRAASGISRRNDSLAHVCQNIAQLSGIGGEPRRPARERPGSNRHKFHSGPKRLLEWVSGSAARWR